MRVAVLIISLVLMVGLGLQSCTVAVGGSVVGSLSTDTVEKQKADDIAAAGGLGIVAALLWLFGAAFVLAKPKVSMWLYLVAAGFCLIGGASGFSDLFVWGVVSLIFALMSSRGARELV